MDASWSEILPDKREERRLQALFLHKAGLKQKEIARMLDVSESAVSQWLKNVRERGIEAIKSGIRPKKKAKLNETQERMLVDCFSKFFTDQNTEDIVLTSRHVAGFIFEEFGVNYNPNYMGRLLKRLGIQYRFKQSPGR